MLRIERPAILFVDDDAAVLRAMVRFFRAEAEEWQITFLPSGAEAIEWLEHHRVDIVVSDFHMPATGGGVVLECAERLQPHAVRVLLTATDMRAEDVHAHWVIAKPVELSFRSFLRDLVRSGASSRPLLSW